MQQARLSSDFNEYYQRPQYSLCKSNTKTSSDKKIEEEKCGR